MTMPDLIESLDSLYGPVRAEMIAVTETTRAAVQGQAALVDELNKEGIVMVATFLTSEDETVCPICAPLNGKQVDESEFPPLHPRCRCDIAYSFEK
jgi:SPP1 gp7 family putative phage head morphogenesis protein